MTVSPSVSMTIANATENSRQHKGDDDRHGNDADGGSNDNSSHVALFRAR